ncbi:spermatogenesis-associated protein 20, partial [Rhizoclosmatium hyalinum]
MATNSKQSQPKTDIYPKPIASTNIKQLTKQQFTNRLINSKSSYLLQHAHNPVDWYPWGEEAFKQSLEQDK